MVLPCCREVSQQINYDLTDVEISGQSGQVDSCPPAPVRHHWQYQIPAMPAGNRALTGLRADKES